MITHTQKKSFRESLHALLSGRDTGNTYHKTAKPDGYEGSSLQIQETTCNTKDRSTNTQKRTECANFVDLTLARVPGAFKSYC